MNNTKVKDNLCEIVKQVNKISIEKAFDRYYELNEKPRPRREEIELRLLCIKINNETYAKRKRVYDNLVERLRYAKMLEFYQEAAKTKKQIAEMQQFL